MKEIKAYIRRNKADIVIEKLESAGDGMIFISPVEKSIKIRTKEINQV
ncbi:MAG: hypothetical protein KJ799_14980 [Bacteroidetes bacterium]|nr:hypothetical protein [Bacteroidota bacterium]MBU1680614.1 hypothetical protein [Bacteroidota bacterium]MBU2508009.1 hypothetical protein [Bacteroidota bacterium]